MPENWRRASRALRYGNSRVRRTDDRVRRRMPFKPLLFTESEYRVWSGDDTFQRGGKAPDAAGPRSTGGRSGTVERTGDAGLYEIGDALSGRFRSAAARRTKGRVC